MKNTRSQEPPRENMGEASKSHRLQSILREIESCAKHDRHEKYLEKNGPQALVELPKAACRPWIKKFSGVLECRVEDLESDLKVHRSRNKESEEAISQKQRRFEPSQADVLVEMAIEKYRSGIDQTGRCFLVPKSGPQIAKFVSDGERPVRKELAANYHRKFSRTATSGALTTALETIQGMAQDSQPTEVHLRIAQREDDHYLDLGLSSGEVVKFNSNGWLIQKSGSPIFRRTALTGEIPLPVKGGSLGRLRKFFNMDNEDFDLILGWLVAILIQPGPIPILFLLGQQGTGKSTAARFLQGLIDAGPAPLVGSPKSERDWLVYADATLVVCIDNMSKIENKFSDLLCQVVTGAGRIDRLLYSNKDPSITYLQRPIVVTSIDVSPSRGDLVDRMLQIELKPITSGGRKFFRELDDEFKTHQAELLGALLDLVVSTLRVLSEIKLTEKSRMPDFERVLAAMDKVSGTDSCASFRNMRKEISLAVVESDPVASLLLDFGKAEGCWVGTCQDLLNALRQFVDLIGESRRDLPSSPRALSSRLRRLAPDLGKAGLKVVLPSSKTRERGKLRRRLLRLNWVNDDDVSPGETVRPSEPVQGNRTRGIGKPGTPGEFITSDCQFDDCAKLDGSDGSDGSDGCLTTLPTKPCREGRAPHND
jgi:hypothetical protein